MPRQLEHYATKAPEFPHEGPEGKVAASSNPAHDESLALGAAQRSPEAWAEIYETYSTAVFRYVHARIFDRETAEDLTSAVFSRAIKGAASYRYRGHPILAWLLSIARNEVSSHRRRTLRRRALAPIAVFSLLRRRSDVPDAPGDGPAHAIGGTDHDATMEQVELRDALGHLTDPQREVIVLRYFVGLDAGETARVLGKEPAAVYSLQARAVAALKRWLE